MHIEAVREYCLAKKGTTEEFPFDESTLVFKVMGKMYALVSLERTPLSINLKCDPERAIQLREEYPEEILSGYHMNKKHWNTVRLEESLDSHLIVEMIDHSYDLVVAKMTKKLRAELEALED
jgi:predicted DNA-binding protein (MmcQ/YjbR family)